MQTGQIMKHLIPLERLTCVSILSVVILSYYYYNDIIKHIPNHIFLLCIHLYFTLSGFGSIYLIISKKQNFIEKINQIGATILSYAPVFILMIPLKVVLLENFESFSRIQSFTAKQLFTYRLFNSIATFLWMITTEIHATILILILFLFTRQDFITVWISYLIKCIYIQFVVDPFHPMESIKNSKNNNMQEEIVTCLPYHFFEILSSNGIIPNNLTDPTLISTSNSLFHHNHGDNHNKVFQISQQQQQQQPTEKRNFEQENSSNPSSYALLYFEKRIGPLHCQLPYFFLGAIFAYFLYEFRLNDTKLRHTYKQYLSHGNIVKLDSFLIQQVCAFFMLLFSIWWIYMHIFSYEVIYKTYLKSDVMETFYSIVTIIACLFVLYSVLISKSNPCHNKYLYQFIMFFSYIQKSSTIISVYFFISHYFICLEYVFLFSFYAVNNFTESTLMCIYGLVISIVISSIFQECVLKPFQRVTLLIFTTLNQFGNFLFSFRLFSPKLHKD